MSEIDQKILPQGAASSSDVDQEKNPLETVLSSMTENPIEASIPYSLDNPLHPYYWPSWKKWSITIIYCLLQIFVTLTSTSYLSVEYVYQDRFGTNSQVSTMPQSFFIFGTAFGCAFAGPLSDIGGRKWIYVISMIFYILTNIGCALCLNMPMLVIFSFLTGVAGSCALSNVAGTIGDLFSYSDSASQPMSFFVASANIGPSIGSPIGEWIGDNVHMGAAWIYWINCIFAGAFAIGLSFVPETLPRIVIQETNYLATLEGSPKPFFIREFYYLIDTFTGKEKPYEIAAEDNSNAVVVKRSNYFTEIRFILVMAFKMFLTEPIILFLGLFNGFAYGLLFLYLDGVFDVFVVNNGLSYIAADLTYLNFVAGVIIVICIVPIQTWLFARSRKNNGGLPIPESRFLLSLVFVWGFPISLFWFAFTSNGKTNYWSCIVAGALLGVADPLLWLAMLNYIIDSYSESGLANSAIAAFTIPSFAIAGCLAHAGVAMFENMTTTWAVATLAFISLGVVVLVYVFYFFGAKIRAKSKLARIGMDIKGQ